MKLTLKDADPELDGTSYAFIEYTSRNDTPSDSELNEMAQRVGYLRISSTERLTPGLNEIGARIKYITSGKGTLTLDRYLRRDLNLPEGTEVEVEFESPQPANEIQIGIPVEDFGMEDYKKICQIYLQNQPLSKGQKKAIYLYSGQEIQISIEMTSPEGISVLTPDTRIKLVEHNVDHTNYFYQDIGGLNNELRLIRERIEIPLKYFDHLKNFGIYPPRGILLYGPPGCGKTMIGRSLCNEIGASLFEIRGPEIIDPYYGKSEKNIREIFAKAKEQAPSVILIDEIDSIASASESSKGDLEKRIATTLLTEMERLGNRKNVIVIATISNPALLDPGLRRPGRFDYEIRIGIPDERGRMDILHIHSRRIKFENKEETLSKVAARTHGYTGADLMLLCREAAFSALQRTYPTGIPELPLRDNTGPTVQIADFDSAMKHVKPTGMREFMVEVPSHLTWKNLGGLSSVKTIITEEVIESIRNPEIFRSIGIRPVKGILLYGPPGTGKTLLAKIIANEAGTNFIPIKGPEILSKWFGESEQRIRQIFSKAREVSPCVIFFDEIDAIFSSRGNYATEASDRVVNQLLTEMDGFESSEGVYVIAATNRFELLDPAFLRPGRFDYQIFLPLPDVEMRKEIFRIHLAGKPITDQIDLEELAKKSEGFSGAHIAEVCRRSGITALKNSGFGKSEIRITMQHLLDAIGTIRFSIEKLEHPHSGVEFA